MQQAEKSGGGVLIKHKALLLPKYRLPAQVE